MPVITLSVQLHSRGRDPINERIGRREHNFQETSTAIETTPGKKEVAPGKPLDTSKKPYVVPTYGFEGEVVALQSCSAPSGYQNSVLVVSPST
jgi:hypothetical protein